MVLMSVAGIVYAFSRGFDHAKLVETAMQFSLAGIPTAWWKLNRKSYIKGR